MEGVKFELKIPFLSKKDKENKNIDDENRIEMQELNNFENFPN